MVDQPAVQQGSAGGTDTITALQGIIRQITAGNAANITAIQAITAALLAIFPRVTGSFTLSAAATTVVTQTGITATSIILLVPTNASAATLMGSAKSLYISARAVGASFTVATASAGAAAGTETLSYVCVNPS